MFILWGDSFLDTFPSWMWYGKKRLGFIRCIDGWTHGCDDQIKCKKLLFGLMDSLSHDQFTKLGVSLWVIWSTWRKAIHEEIFLIQSLHMDSLILIYMNSVCWLNLRAEHQAVEGIEKWYVSNVSIIFDAPCLFLHHLPIVSLHLVALLCIFRN
jgi:hypothetical protein